MSFNLKKALAVAVLSVGAISAQAATTIVTDVNGNFFQSGFASNASLANYTFSITGPSVLDVGLNTPFGGSAIAAVIFNMSSQLGTVSSGASSVFNLGAGTYNIFVSGATSSANFFTLSGSLKAATPVPEPESLALMMAGLGLIGGIASRKAKKLA